MALVDAALLSIISTDSYYITTCWDLLGYVGIFFLFPLQVPMPPNAVQCFHAAALPLLPARIAPELSRLWQMLVDICKKCWQMLVDVGRCWYIDVDSKHFEARSLSE